MKVVGPIRSKTTFFATDKTVQVSNNADKIGGWKTRSVFERYTIVNRGDIAEAMQKLESNPRQLEGHVISHGDETAPTRPNINGGQLINVVDSIG